MIKVEEIQKKLSKGLIKRETEKTRPPFSPSMRTVRVIVVLRNTVDGGD